MNDTELELLQTLLRKLKVVKPELTVLVAELSDSKVFELTHETDDYYCDLSIQIKFCLDDKENKNLR